MIYRTELFSSCFFHLLKHCFAISVKNMKEICSYLQEVFLCSEIPRENRYFSTVIEVRPCSTVFDHARGMFRPCSRYVSTVLEGCFDRARGMFRPCSRYVSTVLEACFDSNRDVFRPCSKYTLNLRSTQTPVSTIIFRSSTNSNLKVES